MSKADDTKLRRLLAQVIARMKEHGANGHEEIENFIRDHAAEHPEFEGLATRLLTLAEAEGITGSSQRDPSATPK